ncbi:MAG: hypothetical protein DRN00_02285 [Thermoplasmata archaeon]|nr:MAG: hypothetical protein DRN03_00385 [Thermoplasmata archaeon]RLF39282.1 MAG: hypothetical protein DRN00_02285 [Thermoplasmata archaeon]
MVMQKDELIQLHTLMLQLRAYFEETCGDDGQAFKDYEELDVNPYHIYKSKREHMLAVFTLGKGIAKLLSCKGYPGFDKLYTRLDQMAKRFKNPKNK